MEDFRTTEAQRKAVREYEKRNDRINVVFPAGTRERMEKLGIKSMGAFLFSYSLTAFLCASVVLKSSIL